MKTTSLAEVKKSWQADSDRVIDNQ